MSTDEKYGHIKELSFRADLRDNKFEFLINMIHLARKYDWIFMDRNGKLANPNIEIIKLLKNSNTHKFLSNPMEFIKGLNL